MIARPWLSDNHHQVWQKTWKWEQQWATTSLISSSIPHIIACTFLEASIEGMPNPSSPMTLKSTKRSTSQSHVELAWGNEHILTGSIIRTDHSSWHTTGPERHGETWWRSMQHWWNIERCTGDEMATLSIWLSPAPSSSNEMSTWWWRWRSWLESCQENSSE